MNTINSILTPVFDVLFGALGVLTPAGALLAFSALLGVLMALVFRWTSNQRGLRTTADRSRAALLAIRLFKNDLNVTLTSQVDLLKAAGLRLWYSVPALFVLTGPFALILAQVGLRYEYRPLRVGETAVVEMRLSDQAWESQGDMELATSAGAQVETTAVRAPHDRTLAWRVRATKPGLQTLRCRVGGQTVEKTLRVVNRNSPADLQATSVVRPGPGLWDRVLHPGEPGFDEQSPVRSVELHYRRARATPIFGVDVPWWATVLLTSMLAALLARPIIGVRF